MATFRSARQTPAHAIQQALGHHQQGQLAEAERLYKAVLKLERNQFDALHLLGMLRYQQGRYEDAARLIDAALKSNSASITALSNYGLVLNKLGRQDEAIATYDKVLALAPDDLSALYNRGIVLHALGRDAEALESYDRALAIQPDDLEVLSDRGNALRSLGRHEEALASYDKALNLAGGHVNSLYNRATLLQELGRFAEALKSCKILLVVQPDHVEALNVRGKSHLLLAQFEAALADYDQALAIDPQHADVLANRCTALVALDRMDEAIAACDRALAIAPDLISVLHVQGLALHALGHHEEALAAFDRALAIEPAHVDALADRSAVLIDLRRYDEALASIGQALAVNPAHVEALNNRGVVLLRLAQPEAALAHFDRALMLERRKDGKLGKTLVKTITNRGTAFVDLGRHRDALKSYQEAVAHDPDYADAHFNEGMVRLCLGDFHEGWKKYEWRAQSQQGNPHRRGFSQPQWLGEESLEGRTVLLHAEQGLGDTIQFARYASLVAQRGARVILEVQPSLTTLMTGVDGVSRVVAQGAVLPPFDLHCPLLSLPLAFTTELGTIPQRIDLPLQADRISLWERRLAGVEHPRVGLVWSGRTAHFNDRNRSIALGQLSALLSHPAIGVVSLQREVRSEDAALLAGNRRVLHIGEEFQDFADTAAAISQLDLVVSVDTSVAHLAGALGKPVWILLPFAPDFRWMLDREDSPWYPTARLFRQPKRGDWDSVVERVRAELDCIGH